MGKLYIINASYLFSGICAVIKPFLDEMTVSKIQVMSTDHKEVLSKRASTKNLPAEFGGLCKCEGLDGCSMGNVYDTFGNGHDRGCCSAECNSMLRRLEDGHEVVEGRW